MTSPLPRDDRPTLWSIGVAVAMVASLAHEVLGHGLGCLADGGSITLVTFLVFRCAGAGVLGDGAGPFGALLIAVVALALFRLSRPKVSAWRLFLLTLGILILFWVSAQMVREALDQSDDWGHVARDLAWPPLWRPVVGAIGIAGYIVAFRIAARLTRGFAEANPARLAIPWLACTVSAVFLGALWHGDRAGSALDAFMTFGLAPLGYLPIILALGRQPPSRDQEWIKRSPAWLAVTIALFVLFATTIAPGIGPLA